MQRWAGVLVTVLAACGGKATNELSNHTSAGGAEFTPTTKAFPELAKADFVILASSGDVIAYAVDGTSAKQLGTLALQPVPDDPETRAMSSFGNPAWWIDRDHLVVHGAGGSDVWIVSTAGAALLPVPPDSNFSSVPKPASSADEGIYPDEQGQGGDVTGMTGQLWWDHCAWGMNEEGTLACFADTYTRIWPPDPSMKFVTTAPPKLGEIFLPTWTDAAPLFAVTKDADSNQPICHANGQPVTLLSPTGQNRGGETHWFGAPAAGMLNEYGDYGMADFYASEFALYDRCVDKPVVVGLRYKLMQDGFWVSADYANGTMGSDQPEYRYVLRNGMKEIAEIPSYVDVAWRPAP